MNLETKITIYKFTPQVFTLTPNYLMNHETETIQTAIIKNIIKAPYKYK